MDVGGAILSAFFDVLFDRLASPQLLEFAKREGLGEKLKKLGKMLLRTRAVLDDAEEKQYDNVDVKEWLDDLQDFADDAEDMLDEFDAEAVSRKLHDASAGEAQNSISSMVNDLTQSIVDTFSGGLRSKIPEIIDRFDDLVQQKDELKLGERVDGRGSDRKREIPVPTSVATEPCVYGREKETEELLQLLLDEKDSEPKFSAIAIVGMGGIGKTTLAQHVYKHDKVQNAFQLRGWAYVSEDFNIVSVTKTILRSINSEINVGDDLNSSQVKLREELKGKKFLVILDDLWNENCHKWESLCAPFHAGAAGSKIVITTRHQEVASTEATSIVYPLQEFSNDACFSLFTRHALGASDFRAHPNLKDIGKKIVEKCKGLPLAAKTLGGLLCTKRNRDEWEEVLNSEIWNIEEKKGGILPYLMLSYQYLPSHLKRCFQYCSIFPKGYEFEEEELVLLWMAEGLIQPHPNEKPEVLGRKYFHNLLSRSFFQQSTTSNSQFLAHDHSYDLQSRLFFHLRASILRIQMHDFIHDLAQFVARDTCCRLEDTIYGKRKFYERARHLSCSAGGFERAKSFEALSKLTRLRTFFCFGRPFSRRYWYSPKNVPSSLLDLPYLRVLSLEGLNIVELPDSIGCLKLLCYLNLSGNPIPSLPESATTLYKLQILMLKGCPCLKKLASTFGNLVNLRHLNILSSNLEGMPLQIGKLTYLQTLSNFVVGKSNYASIKELGPLSDLQGMLKISKMENVIEPVEASEADLNGKPNLDDLELEWSSNSDVSQENAILMGKVLDMLQPHEGLKSLALMGYGGTRFPTWLSYPLFPYMVSLKIVDCIRCTSLPSIGQLPVLEFLTISGMNNVKDIGLEFYGEDFKKSFRALKTLYFSDMKEWENWIPHGEFPRLCELSIQSCSKLVKKLPNHLPSLEQVIIRGCDQLDVSISSFPNKCKVEIDGCKGVVRDKKVSFNSLEFRFKSQIERFNTQELTTVEEFSIKRDRKAWEPRKPCDDLRPLWSNEVGLLQYLPDLRLLEISGCDELLSLFTKEVEQIQRGMPSALRKIKIRNCYALESLPKVMMYNQMCMEEIEMFGCNSLRHVAIGELPPTLKVLYIQRCENMLIVLDEDIHGGTSRKPILKELVIDACPSLKSITLSGQLPATRSLHISNCSDLESVGDRFECTSPLEDISISYCKTLKSLPKEMHNLSHLGMIRLSGCPSLVCFTDGEFLPANLRKLEIWSCKKIQGLPNRFHSLTSLRDLVILNCPGIVSFPEKGFPLHLTTLAVCYVDINEALFEWGLRKLSSLKHLKIRGGSPALVCFPKGMLPASLTELTIGNFPNLTDLSSQGFRILKFLEELAIWECEKLTSFPQDGLPRSLEYLCIRDCPLLKEQCKKDKGREWHKLAHIPNVSIL